MGKRGPHPGSVRERPRDEQGHFVPVSPVLALKRKAELRGRVLAAIKQYGHLESLIAQSLGITLDTLRHYAQGDSAISVALLEARELRKDMAEGRLFAAMNRDEAWAICFYLKTQAKDRGYIERVEQDGRFAVLGLHATVGASKGERQRGDFDTAGYIELFRGFFAGPSDGIPASNGAHESLDTGNANT